MKQEQVMSLLKHFSGFSFIKKNKIETLWWLSIISTPRITFHITPLFCYSLSVRVPPLSFNVPKFSFVLYGALEKELAKNLVWNHLVTTRLQPAKVVDQAERSSLEEIENHFRKKWSWGWDSQLKLRKRCYEKLVREASDVSHLEFGVTKDGAKLMKIKTKMRGVWNSSGSRVESCIWEELELRLVWVRAVGVQPLGMEPKGRRFARAYFQRDPL